MILPPFCFLYKKSPEGIYLQGFFIKKLNYLLPSGLYRRLWILTRSASPLGLLAGLGIPIFGDTITAGRELRGTFIVPLSPCPEGNFLRLYTKIYLDSISRDRLKG
jgi:hypothetical protein